jgi:hypothetical protein
MIVRRKSIKELRRAAEKTAGPVVATPNGVRGISLVGRIGRKPFYVEIDKGKKTCQLMIKLRFEIELTTYFCWFGQQIQMSRQSS